MFDLRRLFFSKKIFTIGGDNLSTREKWLQEKLAVIPANFKILDAGAGELQYKKFCSHLNYTSQDFCQYEGHGDGLGLQTQTFDTSKIDIVSDITNIPVDSAEFDAIMCIEVLEHVPDPVAAVRELTRLLKQGGYLIVTVPFNSLTHFAPFHFSTGFNKYFFRELEKEFEIIELSANGNYFEYLAQEARRIPTVASLYSKARYSTWDKLRQSIFLDMLVKFNDNDNSSELLCFGYQFVGRKK